MNINEYVRKVYVDPIEKWQDCEVKNLSNYRATVKTPHGTQVNRIVKYLENEALKEDGCVYFYQKEKGLN